MSRSVFLLGLAAMCHLLPAQTIVDPATAAPRCDGDHFRLQFELPAFVQGGKERQAATLFVDVVGGALAGHELQAGALRGWLTTIDGNLDWNGTRLAGSLTIEARREGGEKVRTWRLEGIDLPTPAIHRVPGDPYRVEGRFWTVYPRSPGERARFAGDLAGQAEGEAWQGAVRGTVSPAPIPGRFNMGRLVDDALAFHFPMGDEVRTWNHVRLAVLAFTEARDWTAVTGLDVHIASDRPRSDVSLSLWAREADGSWYYVKSAVPLAAAEERVRVHLEDLREAEWVAPGSHVDEDYVFDRQAVTHLALGVVDANGVGDVDCRLLGIDEVPGAWPISAPVTAAVTGKLLSVNDHDLVPAGIFGGYAPYLAQQYRPGCQRDLYPPIYPRVPRQRVAGLAQPSDFIDLEGFWKILFAREGQYRSFAAHWQTLLGDNQDVERLRRFDPAKRRADARDKKRPFQLGREFGQCFARAMRRVDCYSAETWPEISDASLEKRLETVADLDDTERVELHRDVLAHCFPAFIAPRPPPATEAFHIECYGERKQPATLLTNADWRERLHGFATTYAGNIVASGHHTHAEFWNEPYLNWAERSRVNLHARFYDQETAVAGGAVRVRYQDGSSGPEIPHFRWVDDGNGGLKVVDESAHSYWSGRGNGWIYDQMLAVFGPAIKAVDPSIPVIGGWGFRWHEGSWRPWEVIYKPTIDRNIDWIDGIHEHHYQGDTAAMYGAYEVLVAYGVTAHDKWLHVYNTETNDLVDAPARGRVDTPAKAEAASQYRKMVYNARDLIGAIRFAPDKCMARTVIHNTRWPEATRIAFGLLKNLRGRLLHVTTSDPGVWLVASVDGTDPKAMPPHGGLSLVVAVHNDHRRPRTIGLDLRPPTGTRFAGPGVVRQVTVDSETFELGIDERPWTDGEGSLALTLPERGVAVIEAPLAGGVPAASEVVRRQFFAADLLQKVEADRPLATAVTLPAATLASAASAALRLVVEDIADDEAVVLIGDHRLILPRAMTADNVNAILEMPVPLSSLSPETPLVFTVADGGHAGYRVDMASIVLEGRP